MLLRIFVALIQLRFLVAKPNIIFILADDLGWNDVGFHGAADVQTPNLDALAYTGLILNNYYITPLCTPSRSALMTGKYPIHTGMQHTVLYGAEPRGLPLTEKLLSNYLEERGYVNHIVGKWHLGSFKRVYTPLYRGFHSHLGYWTGHQDYFDHTACENPGWGFDMRENMSLAYHLHGKYSTDIFADEAVRIIENHDNSHPLFLYAAHVAVHSGNPYNPLAAPDETVEKFEHIKNFKRRKFAAMLSKLDDAVGKLIKALDKKDMLRNSIVIFSTDNGGPAAGFNLNAASNYPLKGVKNTMWQGGVRGSAFLWSPLLENKAGRVATQMMHISDWLPTLLEVVDKKNESVAGIDGMSVWQALKENTPSPRKEILLNIDDIWEMSGVISGAWKLVKGTTYDGQWDNWYGPSGRNFTYNVTSVLTSAAGKIVGKYIKQFQPEDITNLRRNATIKCDETVGQASVPCNAMKELCLFNIEKDPCEKNNEAFSNPKILEQLAELLEAYNRTAIPPGNLPLDPRGNPIYWNNTFTNFGDSDWASAPIIQEV